MRPFPTRRIFGIALTAASLTALLPQNPAVSNFTYYVDATSSAISNCPIGTSCPVACTVPTCGTQSTPCKSIQDAINIANCAIGANGALEADIVAAAGTYQERLFIFPNIHVIGAGRDVTTIDSQGVACGSGGARCSVAFFSEGAGFGFGRSKVKFSISGFRLTHGTGSSIIQGTSVRAGGGIVVFGDIGDPGWPHITDCRIEDNTLAGAAGDPDWNGAGIYISSGSPTISGNIIQRNVTMPPDLSGQSEAEGQGAGIYTPNEDCHPIITRNVIRNNVAVAQLGEGGGIRLLHSNIGTIVSNNIIVGNVALDTVSGYAVGGGGISAVGYGSAYNNLIVGNISRATAGGLEIFEWKGAITNNTIVGNVLTQHTVPKGSTLSGYGGGMYLGNYPLSTTPTAVRNNILNRNDATTLGGGGALYTSSSGSAIVENDDFFADLPNEIRGDRTDATVIGSNGNISLSPVFTNAPLFWDHTNAAGTATTAIVFDSTRYAVNDWIEYNDDGIPRKITAINNTNKTLTFTPGLASGTTVTPRIVSNWGTSAAPGGPDVNENFRLTTSSPLRDAGTNTGAPAFDLDDLPRPTDGDLNGSVITDIGAYEFRFADTDGDMIPDSSDCAPLVNSAWNTPDQVPSPLAISSAQMLSWTHIPQANVYSVYGGTITTPFTYNPACLIPEVPGLSASIAGAPPALNSGLYYLVGGVNTCGAGPIHSVPTVNPPAACPPQSGDTDGDGIQNVNDNCPVISNSTQLDPDHDTLGSACDNCPALYNPGQLDTNGNSLGDDCEDVDGDTYTLLNDCNDNNPNVHPGATEICNAIDDNCVNGVDEGFDVDADGFTSCGGDCDDGNNAVHPGVAEICNGIDDNCANGVDEGDAALCPDSDLCTQDVCGGVSGCQHPAASDGTPCNDGNACTAPDTCQTGICQPGGVRDADGDAHPDSLCGGNDCNDLDGQVWLAPVEAANLVLSTSVPTIPSWDSQDVFAGPGTVYDLVSGSFGSGSGVVFSTASCLQGGGPASYSDIRPDPTLNNAYWYLARGRNSCGTGTYGSAPRDTTIPACP